MRGDIDTGGGDGNDDGIDAEDGCRDSPYVFRVHTSSKYPAIRKRLLCDILLVIFQLDFKSVGGANGRMDGALSPTI